MLPTKRSFLNATDLSAATPSANIVELVPEGATPGATTYDQLVGIVHSIDIGTIDVSDFYEEDLILVQIEFTQNDPTTSQDVQLWSLSLLGVSHQDGAEISV